MAKGFDIALAIVFVAGLLVLVRPKSQGPALVTSVLNGFTGAIKGATGGGSW